MIFATSSLTHGTVQNSQKTREAFPAGIAKQDHPLTYRRGKHGSCFPMLILLNRVERKGRDQNFSRHRIQTTGAGVALEKLTTCSTTR